MGMSMGIQIVVAYAPTPRNVQEIALTLADGSTVGDAIAATKLLVPAEELKDQVHFEEKDAGSGVGAGILAGSVTDLTVGIWGRKATLLSPLRNLDRVEIYRPLKVDPKVARRARFAAQGAKKAGLFAKRRAGAKTGY